MGRWIAEHSGDEDDNERVHGDDLVVLGGNVEVIDTIQTRCFQNVHDGCKTWQDGFGGVDDHGDDVDYKKRDHPVVVEAFHIAAVAGIDLT
jgi:hypothetical protein